MRTCEGYRLVESEPVEPVATYVDDSDWMIQSVETPLLFWSNADGWVEMEDGELFTGHDLRELHLPDGGEWVEAFMCDACGKVRAERDGEWQNDWNGVLAVDQEEPRFFCAYCVAKWQLQEEQGEC